MNYNSGNVPREQISTSDSNEKSMLGSFGELKKEESLLKKEISQIFSDEKNVFATLESLYKKYTSGMDDVTKTSSSDLKRNFDEYMGNVEQNFKPKIDHNECKILKAMFNKFDENVSEVEKAFGGTGEDLDDNLIFSGAFFQRGKNDKSQTSNNSSWEKFFIREDLKFDFFYLYGILVKLWLGEHIRKSDIELIQPCKVLIIRSLIKRKFDDEIDMREGNKKPQNN
jgi:hypothetical protein